MGSYKPLKEKEKNLFYKGFPPFPFGIFPTHHSVDKNRSDRYLGRRKNKLVRGETYSRSGCHDWSNRRQRGKACP